MSDCSKICIHLVAEMQCFAS